MIEFRALGALSITDDGRELAIGGARQRRLVAMLLIHRNTVVSVDRLADAVFAGEPTRAANTTLRSYVARLRKVLDNEKTGTARLVTQAPGYELRVPDDTFDVARFETAVTEARSLLARGDSGGTSVVLREVMRGWRGDPYAEFDDEDWARPEAQRLGELRLVALETLYDAELACGRAADAVPELEALAALHPLREQLRTQLMTALYRCGRQADALRSYREHREAMVEDLGLDPAPALRELEERILAHDATLLLPLSTGTELRGYVLQERLGTGQDGTVHVTQIPGVDRDAVIRVIPSEIADHPAFVRAFDATAHRVASLRHPAIVPIHDHWREPGAAYLAMRRMRGGALADRLDRGPLPRDQIEAVVRRIGGALVAAHGAGIVHGRVTTRSVLYDGGNQPFLGDFSLGGLTPDGGQTDDVADFAVLVRACLVGHHIEAAEDVVARVADGFSRPDAPGLVAMLLKALAGDAPDGDRPLANPYKGLRAFDEVDAVDFFGRADLVDELVRRLRRDDVIGRLALVVGGSGTGKSSVVRAGLLPRIRRGDPPGAEDWFITTMLPGAEPFEHLAESLRRIAVTESGDVASELAGDVGGIDRVLRRSVPGGGQLLLVIDQFEELFTSASERDQRAFLDGVMGAVSAHDSRLRVVGTLRADFYDRPLAFHGFGAAVNDATVTITAMSPAALESAIVAPANRVGRSVEGALAAELVDAVAHEPAGLPALQFTLYELAERSTDVLRLTDYRELGGIEGAIAARAEHLHRSLEPGEQALVRQVFERLVVLDDDGVPSRRRAARTDLIDAAGTPDVGPLIDRWAEARLLTLDRNEQTRIPTVDLAHEALLREWPRLRRWIREDREALLVLGQLRDAAAGWIALDREADALYRGTRLEVALNSLGSRRGSLTPLEQDFLDASAATRDADVREATERMERQARANRRLRTQLAVIAVALVVALIGGFVAIDQRREAIQSHRIATSRELAAAAEATLEDDPERSILLALAAIDVSRDHGDTVRPEAVEALHRAVTSSRIVLSVPGLGGLLDWSPDGSVFVTEGPEESGMVDVRNATTGESVLAFRGHDIDINHVAFNGDGSMLATTGDDGAVRVWERETGDLVSEHEAREQQSVWGPSFSPDGMLLAAGWGDDQVLRVVDVRTGELVFELEDTPAYATDFSPDGSQLVVGGFDEFATSVVDITSGTVVQRLGDGSQTPIRAVEFSPDGRWIATAEGDGVGRLWDASTGTQRFGISGHSTAVNDLAWSPDGGRIATVSDDGTAIVTEVTDGGLRQLLSLGARDTRNGLGGVAFSPDGDRIITGDWALASAKIWDVTPTGGAEWASLEALPFARGSATFTPDGDALVVSRPGRELALHDPDTGAPMVDFDTTAVADDDVMRLALSPDGTLLAGADTLPVHLWDTTDGLHLRATDPPAPDETVYVVDMAWSPDGELLAVAAADGDGGWVTVVDREADEVARIDEEDGVYVGALDFTPEGAHLLTARLPPRHDPSRQSFRVWDWEAGRVVREFDVEAGAGQLAPDPTSAFVATSRRLEGVADVWDTTTGQLLTTLRGSASMYDIAFSQDGTTVATAGADGTILLWDPRTGSQLLALRGHQAAVGSVAFSPDGRRLASLDESGLVRVWALDLDDLIALARQRLTRTLDDDECRQYLHLDRCPD